MSFCLSSFRNLVLYFNDQNQVSEIVVEKTKYTATADMNTKKFTWWLNISVAELPYDVQYTYILGLYFWYYNLPEYLYYNL